MLKFQNRLAFDVAVATTRTINGASTPDVVAVTVVAKD
jgi:hypothetical protein